MNDAPATDVLRRLRSIEGHVHAVVRMADEGAYCIDVIRQIQAVQGALDSVANLILENHLNSCVLTAVRGDDPAESERVLTEIAGVFRSGNGARPRYAPGQPSVPPASEGGP
jgi:CsoR family transcriptional regulator, copper-sensing transcriptional repressor